MATVKLLGVDNCPDSSFKLSTVSKSTIEVSEGFNAQLSKVTNSFNAISSSLTTIQKQISSDVSNYKNYMDAKRLNALSKLVTSTKSQVTQVNDRRNNMKTWANKDIAAIKEAAKKKAWVTAIDTLMKESNLSKETIKALETLKGLL